MLGLVVNEIMAQRSLIEVQPVGPHLLCGKYSVTVFATLLASESTLRTVTVDLFFCFVFLNRMSHYTDHPLPINPWILGYGMHMRNRMVYYHSKQFAKMHFHSEGKHAVRDESLGSMSDLHVIPGSTGCCCVTWGTFLTLHMPYASDFSYVKHGFAYYLLHKLV